MQQQNFQKNATIDSLNILGGEAYLVSQLNKHIGLLHDLGQEELQALENVLPSVFKKVKACWSGVSNKYYNVDGISTLDINNSNHYCQFLLILAREISIAGHSPLADKIFGLNKMLNGCDVYHAVELPPCFFLDHSLGLVVGRAKLGDKLFLSQNCTIGSNPGRSIYPTLGTHNYLMSNTTIIGSVKTGDRVIFATGSMVKDMDIPSDSIVFGRAPNNIIKPFKPEAFKVASPFIL